MIKTYSSSLTCRILYPALSHLSSLRLLSLSREKLQNPPTHARVSMLFLQSPLDVILATTKLMERSTEKCVCFYNPPKPNKRLSKAIFVMYFSVMYLSMKFISRHMKIELLLYLTVCAISRWNMVLFLLRWFQIQWATERGKSSDYTHGLDSRVLPLWQFTVIQQCLWR